MYEVTGLNPDTLQYETLVSTPDKREAERRMSEAYKEAWLALVMTLPPDKGE